MLEVIHIRLSVANCYLLKTGTGYVLVDTGFSWHRRALHRALEDARCNPGDIKLVVITHGDMDHTGNCVWLRKRYGAPVAMHGAEVRAVERGNMFLSRKSRPNPIVRALAPVAARLFSPRFTPQVLLNDGDNLSAYGLDAKVLHLPGHSLGSIGVLTAEGQFFCGDLLTTRDGKPVKGELVDDAAQMDASIERIKSLPIEMLYPGHGRPFAMAELTQASRGPGQ